MIRDFISLFFPEICPGCGQSLFKNEHVLCTRCFFKLPGTRFHNESTNPVAQLFWGRADISFATALLYYRKGGRVQKLIHRFKYRGMKEIGHFLGECLGRELKQSPLLKIPDVIIPVPLHEKKEKKRGFNQSEIIARGISSVLECEMRSDLLIRTVQSETQTRKSRFKRWENVREIFRVTDREFLKNKHILLVDDVITTGSTLEACASVLLEVEGLKVSVAALGYSVA